MGAIKNVIIGMLNLLPDDPFSSTITQLQQGAQWWGYVAYFVPINAILALASGWAMTMGAYYAADFVTDVIKKVAD